MLTRVWRSSAPTHSVSLHARELVHALKMRYNQRYFETCQIRKVEYTQEITCFRL